MPDLGYSVILLRKKNTIYDGEKIPPHRGHCFMPSGQATDYYSTGTKTDFKIAQERSYNHEKIRSSMT